MKISAIKCKKCGDIIYSRTLHDFHYCTGVAMTFRCVATYYLECSGAR